MNINDLKEKVDNLVEDGYGNLEIYKDGGDGCADRIIKLRFQLLYEGKFYLTDRENNMYRNILDFRIEDKGALEEDLVLIVDTERMDHEVDKEFIQKILSLLVDKLRIVG